MCRLSSVAVHAAHEQLVARALRDSMGRAEQTIDRLPRFRGGCLVVVQEMVGRKGPLTVTLEHCAFQWHDTLWHML
jgi:hypothetical protein